MTALLARPSLVVLTGGTEGIGRALCDRLLGAGHEVILVARRAAALTGTPRLHPMPCDLSDPAATRQLTSRISAEFGPLSLLINNAALQIDRALTGPGLDLDRLEDEVILNLLAPALLINGLLPSLSACAAGAAILNVNSGLAIFPKQRTALYCATKAGLHSLSASLRYQLEGTSVRVIEAFLPLVDTGMTRGRGSGKMTAEAAADSILRGLAKGKDRIWVGKAALVPSLNRLAPGLGRLSLRGGR